MGVYAIILIAAFILAIIGIWIDVMTSRFLLKQLEKILKKINYDRDNPTARQKFYGSLIVLAVLVVLLIIVYLL